MRIPCLLRTSALRASAVLIGLTGPLLRGGEPLVVVLEPTGQTLATRTALYGQNVTSGDWHGSTQRKRGPILWDAVAGRPDPAWDELSHAYPLRVVRYHTGNIYPWRDAVGPVEERKPILDESGSTLDKGVGLQEFLRWLETLPDHPEAALIASPFRPTGELADLVAYCNARTGPMAELRAAHGHAAPYGVKYWELGNETDWFNRDDLDITRAETEREKKHKLLVGEYVERCRERIEAMRAVDPSIKIFAHAQTAPWPVSTPQWRAWHRAVLRGIGSEIDGIVIHPYYDGYSVPYVLDSVDMLIADIHELAPAGHKISVIVNEHARWVNYKIMAERPQSWGLQGAISTGDFLLRGMARPEIAMANYWCYLHRGPWRVLNADWEDGGEHKFGTGIHWLFKVLNDAALPRYELLTPEPPGANYAAAKSYPYTVTAGLFSDSNTDTRVLVAVNRSADEAARLTLPASFAPTSGKLKFSVVTGESLTATNVTATPDAVTLQTTVIEAEPDAASGVLHLELPARSVASWRW